MCVTRQFDRNLPRQLKNRSSEHYRRFELNFWSCPSLHQLLLASMARGTCLCGTKSSHWKCFRLLTGSDQLNNNRLDLTNYTNKLLTGDMRLGSDQVNELIVNWHEHIVWYQSLWHKYRQSGLLLALASFIITKCGKTGTFGRAFDIGLASDLFDGGDAIQTAIAPGQTGKAILT